MIAVEIPAALAERPEVVPVDPWRKGRVAKTLRMVHNVGWCASAEFIDVTPSLVGQRVALAWRETCPTCGGDAVEFLGDDDDIGDACSADCDSGSRMVVGWTAEVEAVVSLDPVDDQDDDIEGWDGWTVDRSNEISVLRVLDGSAWKAFHYSREIDSGETWPPGRYALVLRDVQPFTSEHFTRDDTDPRPCRPFSGFVELDEVRS